MKHLNLFAFTALVLTLLLTSCESGDDKTCTGDERIIAFPTMTAASFQDHLITQQTDNTSYQTSYAENVNTSGYSRFALKTTTTGACSFEPIFLYTTLELTIADAGVKDTIAAACATNIFVQAVPASGTVYLANEYFDTKGDGVSNPILNHAVYIPYQGSRAADSLYFWGNVLNWDLGAQYKIAN